MRRLEDDKEELKPVFYEQHHKKNVSPWNRKEEKCWFLFFCKLNTKKFFKKPV